MTDMGALVTLELPDDSPTRDLPWIITIGPLDDDDGWEPVVTGPYEREHALALAGSVVADEDLMAVVEPLLPLTSVAEIEAEIITARSASQEFPEDLAGLEHDHTTHEGHSHEGHSHEGHSHESHSHEHEQIEVEPADPPPPAEIRAGMARVTARLSSR